jgi:dTDP-4-amino-4,6-dideoxygalactose transaminase
MKVPFVDLPAQEREVAEEAAHAIAEVAREACFILGERVERFERWLASACGTAHAVGVASGTDALEIALRAVGVGKGHAVVTTAFSFVAAAEAIAAAGARPVFCDVDAETLNVSLRTVREAVARARAEGLRVKAIVPVHLFGLCAPVKDLAELARREEAFLLEDAAQALGGRDGQGRPVGAAGDAACFSFFPTKNLGAWGDGGAIVTWRDEVAARARRLRAHGASAPYVHDEPGRNSRLDAVQAAVLLVKTSRLQGWMDARERIASRYRGELADVPLRLPHAPALPARHAWHAFVVRTDRRDELAAWLRSQHVETRVYYPVPLHRQPCFGAYSSPPLPACDAACRTALALPIYPSLEGDRQAYVIEQIARFFR